ncbi:MAG: cytochrome-c peroxidase, partial [Proteobacteria bacterium]|nr:cytochrome-c peroxidase [Pseudomonadota bacterium]
ATMRSTFGDDVLANDERALRAALWALEVFQQDPREFYPYSSKYDAVLRGKATLTPEEARGLALFVAADKGNCASCHPAAPKRGALPAFTDYGLVALAVPRNRALAQNRDPAWYDLGLCGPLRTDLARHPEYCGLFRTPTLRNVALRRAFFHNGALHSLRDVVAFYATRDTDPARWYGRDVHRRPRMYDDLPARYRENVNQGPPFGGQVGRAPALTPGEIRAIVAFLGTLTDGWTPGAADAAGATRPAASTR